MNDDAVTLGNTLLPMLIIGAVAFVVPWVLTPKATRSQVRVLTSMAVSVGVMLLVSAAIFAAFDKREMPGGEGLAGAFLVGWFYLRSGLSAALIWGPALGLAWLWLAQRVERLRGEDLAHGVK